MEYGLLQECPLDTQNLNLIEPDFYIGIEELIILELMFVGILTTYHFNLIKHKYSQRLNFLKFNNSLRK